MASIKAMIKHTHTHTHTNMSEWFPEGDTNIHYHLICKQYGSVKKKTLSSQ